MWLFYIDESGTKTFGDGQRFYILGGIALDESRWRGLDAAMRLVLESYRLRCAAEIMASVQASPRVCRRWTRTVGPREIDDWSALTMHEQFAFSSRLTIHFKNKFELHGADLFQGRELYEGVSLPTRLAMADAALGVAEAQGGHLLYARLDKDAHRIRYGSSAYSPDSWCFTLVAEVFQGFLTVNAGLGLVIADQGGTDESAAKIALRSYQSSGTPLFGHVCDRMIDSVHFVDSVTSPALQISDLCTYVLNHIANARPTSATIGLQARVQAMRASWKHMP